MNPIQQNTINANAPYRVVCTTGNVAVFMTDNGLCYEAGFVEDYTFFEENSFQFYLKELTGSSAPRDPKIMDTVGAIVEDFLNQNESVVVYMCDTSDGKQAVRNRIFVHWFDMYSRKDEYTLLTGSGTVSGYKYFAAAIVAKKNPDYQDIINAFAFFKMQARAKFPDAEIE